MNQIISNDRKLIDKLQNQNVHLNQFIDDASEIRDNLTYLDSQVDKVDPWLAGDLGAVDQDDLSKYFDDVLTGDGAGQFAIDDPSYEDYKKAFMSKDPGSGADMVMRENIREAKKAQRSALESIINDTYKGMQIETANIGQAYTTNQEGQQQKWAHILYGAESDQEVPAEVVCWL